MTTDDPVPSAESKTVAVVPVSPAAASGFGRWAAAFVLLFAVLAIVAVVLAWRAEQRVRSTERELVKRQQDSGERVAEALLLSKQAQDGQREATAKVALLEQRLNEVSVQRVQLEDLMQSLARSRDDNLVAEVDSAMRAAAQQAAITGSVEPLVSTLKQVDERLARANQPRLEPVRRAIAHDLEKSRAASVADAATLSIRIDEAVRMVDEMPLLSASDLRRDLAANGEPLPRPAAAASAAATAASASDAGIGAWLSRELGQAGRLAVDGIWNDVRQLFRVTRIDRPEGMLVSPEQGYFLRENLKLRLLNARLALLSRQTDAAQADLRSAQASVDRYFDRSSRRTQTVSDLLRQLAVQVRQTSVPRPDETFAALAVVGGAR